MWQRFTEQTRQAVYYAQEEAKNLHESMVGPEHLLLGLLRVSQGVTDLLAAVSVSPEAIRAGVEERVSPKDVKLDVDLQLTPGAKKAVDLAAAAAKEMGDGSIRPGHLLLALVDEQDGIAAQVLTGLGVTRDAVAAQVRRQQEKADVELLTLDEAVQFLGTSKPTLYRVLGQGDLKGLKVGRQWRFRKADLVAYMERSPVAVAAAPAGDLDTELGGFMKMTVEAGRGEALGGMQMRHLGGTPEEKTEALLDLIVSYAVALHASDIHLEPIRQEGVTSLLLRYRIDGVLQEVRLLPGTMHESLAARLKTKADMSLPEKRVPQDGRFPLHLEDKDFDVRVSAVPSMLGESFVMRIILKSDILLGLDSLGLSDDDLGRIRGLIRQPNGLVIVTGPSGAGKTTTIYGCLQELARMEVKTLTVEDPVEVPISHVTQVQVNKRSGVTFPAALRAFLRQDPDVIFVGETREPETAALAAEASLTGHLVLTTLHTNDAPTALTRLREMGLEPYLIAATVTGVLAQRLCRRLCDECKEAYHVQARELLRFGFAPGDPDRTITLHRSRGCDKCRHKGYRGRVGLFDLLVMTDELAALIVKGASATEMAARADTSSLWQDGLRKVLSGVTTPDEVLRVCTAI